VGVRVLAVAASALALVSPASFLRAHEVSGGGFAETNGVPSPELTAWSVLGLAAAGTPPSDALAYLRAHEDDLETPTAVALVALAEIALGDTAESLLARLPARPAQTNQLVWTILALRAAHRDVPPALVRDLLSAQASSGGWSWTRRGRPDSDDTAAAIQALRADAAAGRPIDRAVAFVLRHQNRDGGFEITDGAGSNAQSTAWAMQGLVAAGRKPGRAAYRYLARLRRPDGSYRYSARYAITPVWVTAQVLPAIAGKPFPLR